MAPDRPQDPESRRSKENDEDRDAKLLWKYLDRLNAGEAVNLEEIEREHPDVAPELIKQLEAFKEIGSEIAGDIPEPLGTLGDYTLRRQIGRGGMGVVYEAWEGSMDRVVALKVLPAGVAADTRASTRFMREAQAAGKLNHPNVVGVYSTGVKEGTPWYAMEYVEGQTLAQVLAKLKDVDDDTETVFGNKDRAGYFEKLARCFADVADGLQHAHSKGVTHRDIKPSNLILDGEGRLRILDFGLARLEGQESLTISGDLVGTPLYMSPEQARRKKIPVDHRTDVYSLGATMYEALCGRPPFRGRDHADTLSQIIERDPTEPRRVNPRVPKDFETIVLQCLRKDAGDRYRTAEALGQDLRRFMRGDPVEARPPSRMERALRLVRRQRVPLAIAAVFVVLASVSAVLWMRADQTAREARAAEARALMRDLAAVLARAEFVLEASLASRAQRLLIPGGALAPIDKEELQRFVRRRALSEVTGAAERLEALRSALSARSDVRDLHLHLARAWRFLGREALARRAARDALELDAGFAPAAALLDAAEQSSLRREETEPRWGSLWRSARNVLQQGNSTHDNWRQALAALDELLTIHRRSPLYVGADYELRIWRGVARLGVGDVARAKEDFAVVRDRAGSQIVEPTLLLAKCYLEGAEEDRARADELCEELLTATALERHDEIKLWIVALFRAADDLPRAVEWAARIDDRSLGARLRAYLLLRAKSWEEAMRAGRETVAESPENLNAHLLALAASIEWLARGPPPSCETLVECLELLASTLRLDPANDYANFLRQSAAARLGPYLTRERTRSMYVPTSCIRPLLLLSATLFAGIASAQESIFDDFRQDPDPFDGVPMMWTGIANACCPGEVLAADDPEDGICLRASSNFAYAILSEEVFTSDVTIQARVSRWSFRTGLMLHFDGGTISGYQVRVDDAGVSLGNWENGRIVAVTGPSHVAVGEEILLELRSQGPMVEFRVWPVDGKCPVLPTIELEDATHRFGSVGINGWQSPNEPCYAWARIDLEPTPKPTPMFLRGDCNDDGAVDISDAIFSLRSLFLGDGNPGCDDACDSNDDGAVDISDAVATLGVLFQGTGLIPLPGMTACGVDPTGDGSGCAEYKGCP